MSDKRYQEEYLRRIHKVQDYIEQHTGRALTVEELSNVAGFSMFHFSRIFQGVLQESLIHYVNRIRMEQALFLLAHREDKNMTDIALELGFSDSAVFSRTFKNYYRVSPREYRQEYRENCEGSFLLSEYHGRETRAVREEQAADRLPVQGEITIERLDEKQMVYVRHTGTYETLAKEYAGLIQTLFTHAEMQNLLVEGQNWVLAIYHDNPEFGEEEQFRTSLCLTVPEDIRIQDDGVLGQMKLESGLYAVGHFRIQAEQYPDAWNHMYQEWLTCSGYVPRNAAPFEVYRNDPSTDENHINEVDIYVPIEPILL